MSLNIRSLATLDALCMPGEALEAPTHVKPDGSWGYDDVGYGADQLETVLARPGWPSDPHRVLLLSASGEEWETCLISLAIRGYRAA